LLVAVSNMCVQIRWEFGMLMFDTSLGDGNVCFAEYECNFPVFFVLINIIRTLE